jgi:protein TonB
MSGNRPPLAPSPRTVPTLRGNPTGSGHWLGPVLRLGRRHIRQGTAIGIAGALTLHGSAVAHGAATLTELWAFAEKVDSRIEAQLRVTFDIDLAKAPAHPAPEPEPEPQPEPQPVRPRLKSKPAEPEPTEAPPAAAEAGKLLTAEPDPNEPVDLTGEGFVTGDGSRFAGGITASTGTSRTAVRDRRATADGVVGGTASRPVASPAQVARDLSRVPRPQSTQWDDCGFPPEADVEQIDFMRVTLVVTVATNGSAKAVTVLNDPGYGFGRLARRCAMRKRYVTGLDSTGRPIITATAPFVVRFTR